LHWSLDVAFRVNRPASGERYIDRLVQTVIGVAEKDQILHAQYGAVMIDESHAFEAAWLKLVVSMMDQETNSLIIVV
jgi:hypothetical protein